uniref:PGF-pre-PGF domain-containing protein n=1 Tax=Archaeoglobus fulgidus TaxID=2234 RepID=A0A7J3M1L8_ARCFL
MRWIKLDTRLTGKDENYNYYRAEVPGFSYFAVILESPTTPTPTPTPTPIPIPTPAVTPTPKPTPGFEAIFAIAGLAAIANLLRRELNFISLNFLTFNPFLI